MKKMLLALALLTLMMPEGMRAQSAAPFCPENPVRSSMDITIDDNTGTAQVFVYNISGNYLKTGLPNALLFRVDMTDLQNMDICYDVADESGKASYSYDPLQPGCVNYWFIFCPLGNALSSQEARLQCLGGSAIPQPLATGPINPCPAYSGRQPSQVLGSHLPSHNELYLCNTLQQDYAPLCWPLIIIFGILIGASFLIGRNPLAAFDLSSPRMGRGKIYTARVQQKSFDLLGYAFAAQSVVETSGKFTSLFAGERELKDENGNTIKDEHGKPLVVDREGHVKDSKGKIIGKHEDGKVIGLEGKNKGIVFAPNDKGSLTAIGKLEGNKIVELDGKGNVKKMDVVGPEGRTTGTKPNVIGEINEMGGIKIYGKGDVQRLDTSIGSRGWGDYAPLGLMTKGVGLATNEIASWFGEGSAFGKKESSGGKEREGGKKQPIGDKKKLGIAGGRDSNDKDEEKIITSSTAATSSKGSQLAILFSNRSSQSSASLFTAPNVLGLLSFFRDKPWQSPQLTAHDREVIDGLSEGNFSDRLSALIAFILDKIKENFKLEFTTEGGNLLDHVKVSVKTVFRLMSTASTLSMYTKGLGALFSSHALGKGLTFIENFNNKNTIFGTSWSSYGNFASWVDPEYAGGAGMPYGLSVFSPMIKGIKDRIDYYCLTSSSDADYVAGVEFSNAKGEGIRIIFNSDGNISAEDLSGKQISGDEAYAKLKGINMTAAEQLNDWRNGKKSDTIKVSDGKWEEMSAPQRLLKIEGAEELFLKIGTDGASMKIGRDEFQGAIDRQQEHLKAKLNLIRGIMSDYPGMQLDGEEKENLGKISKIDREMKHADEINGISREIESLKNILNLDPEKKAIIQEKIDALETQKQNLQKNAFSLSISDLKAAVQDFNRKDNNGEDLVSDEMKDIVRRQLELYAREGLISYDVTNALSVKGRDFKGLVGELGELEEFSEHENNYYKMQSLGLQASSIAKQIDSYRIISHLLDSKDEKDVLPAIMLERAKLQFYMDAETAAQISHQFACDAMKNGLYGIALDYLGEDEEGRKEIKATVEENIIKLEEKMKRLDAESPLLGIALNERSFLQNTKWMLKQMEERNSYAGALTEQVSFENGINDVRSVLYSRALAFSAGTELLNSSTLLGLDQTDVLSTLTKNLKDINGMDFQGLEGDKLKEMNDNIAKANAYSKLCIEPINLAMADLLNTNQRIGQPLPKDILKQLEENIKIAADANVIQNGVDSYGRNAYGLDHEESMKIAISHKNLLDEIIKSRDYSETGWERNQILLELELSLKNAEKELNDAKTQDQKNLIAESFNRWVGQFASAERMIYATSEEFLENKVGQQYVSARFSAYYLSNPEQDILEGQDIFGRTGRLLAPMPFQGYPDYLYGGMKQGLPGAWEWNLEREMGQTQGERQKLQDLPRESVPDIRMEQMRQAQVNYQQVLVDRQLSQSESSKREFSYKGREVVGGLVEGQMTGQVAKDAAKAEDFMKKQDWLPDEWKPGDPLTPERAVVYFALTRDAYRDDARNTYGVYKKYDNVEDAAKGVYDPETGKSEISKGLATTKKNQEWYARDNKDLYQSVQSLYNPEEFEPPKQRKIGKKKKS